MDGLFNKAIPYLEKWRGECDGTHDFIFHSQITFEKKRRMTMVYYPHTSKQPNMRITVLCESFTKNGPKENKSLETDMTRLVTVISVVEWRQDCSEFNQPLLKLTLTQA